MTTMLAPTVVRTLRPSSRRRFARAASSSSAPGNTNTSGAGGSSSNIASRLIDSAQPHIPTYGFTHAALRAGQPADLHHVDSWTLNSLFPGGSAGNNETSVPIRLFRRWDRLQWQSAVAEASANVPETSSRAGSHNDDEAVRQAAARILEHRLRLSAPVKQHLLETFSQLSAVAIPAPLKTLLSARLPLIAPFMPTNIPNPLPLLQRSFDLADDALHTARSSIQQQQQQQQGAPQTADANAQIPIYGTTWYTTRLHMAMAYTASELHLLSQASQSVDHSAGILHTILDAQLDIPKVEQRQGATHSLAALKQWIEWGGRGWVGILRSRGL